MNTVGQEIFATDNARNVEFRNNVVVAGILAPNSIECTTDAFITGSLYVTGNVTTTVLKSTGTGGVKIRTSANTDIVKFFDSGTSLFYTDISVTGTTTLTGDVSVGNLSLSGSLSGYSPFWVAGKIDGSVAGAVPTVVTRKGDKGSQITCVRKQVTP